MNCERPSVTSPSVKTPTVCVAVTISPSSAACHGVPRRPTRYAVTIDFPYPGESACAAPQNSAAASDARTTQKPSCSRPTSCAKPESATRSGACSELPLVSLGGGAFVGATCACTDVTSRGEESRLFGYARNSSLVL